MLTTLLRLDDGQEVVVATRLVVNHDESQLSHLLKVRGQNLPGYSVQTMTNAPPEALPRHVQVQQRIQAMLQSAEFVPGDRIPSERELAEQLGISRMTVRRAVNHLVNVGVLERDSTAGTRVSQPKVQRVLGQERLNSLTQMVAATGGVPGGYVLSFEQMAANELLSEHLKVALGTPLYKIRRVRLVDRIPFCVETSVLPVEAFPDLNADDVDGDHSLYQVLEQRFGLEVGVGESTISVTRAGIDEATILNLPEETSVLIFRSTVQDRQGRPFEYLYSVNHPDLVTFSFDAHK